ncbi:MAG: alpha/beta hydrolase [Polyangiaceae bacterium]
MTLRLHIERAVTRTFLALPTPVLRRIVGPPRRSPEGFELEVQTQALLWLMRVSGQPELAEGGVEKGRRAMDRTGSLLATLVDDVTTDDRMVPGAAGQRRARIYMPESARGRVAPGLVWFHGGGFVVGSIDSHDGICRALSSRAGVIVVSVDYRLAPEHRFPAGLDDALAATRWVLGHGLSLGIDPGALAVGGDSAGGNLSAVVAQTLRHEARHPAFQLLLYPATDCTRSMASHRHFRDGLILTERSIDWFTENYLPAKSFETDPRASPLFATDLRGLAPALVVTAGFDPLRDEGLAYAEKMRAAGVAVEHVCAETSVHGFMQMTGALPESARMFALIAARLRQALSSPAARSAA